MEAVDRLDAFYRDPYPVYADARRAPGLTFVPELDAWLVARHADVREVLSRPEDFSSAGALRPDVVPGRAALAELAGGVGGGKVVLTADGPEHQRLRRPLTRGFSPARVAAALPFVAGRAAALIGSFAGAGKVEWMSAYARPLPADVIGHLFGLDPGDVQEAILGGEHAEDLLFRPLAEEEQVDAARRVVALQRLLDGYARSRRREPREDVTSEMVRALAPGDGEPTAEQRGEVVSNLQNLLLAGHLTTTALLGTSLLHLLRDRRQWELLCERPELIPAAIEEAARYDAPVQGFRRTVTRSLELSGTPLKAGDVVFAAYGSAGRDEAVHDDAERFDITRESSARHLSFGHGVHGCPGSQLARHQVRITLELLVRELPGLRPAGNEPVTMAPTMLHRSPERLPLAW
ncbi:cytochrome P450 [Planomonospora sp. ID67723]|uniref:cytochrome P450 n=1 Tax=Planomonospora sp. ID67723 TaxID=2738134 RepID=UPI0018C4505D|nr:cytochrome P450 [Planomonospora sp. ID67723]MBG0833154.1 cytochrome P450 [Planomonospora sp. ID67723]